MKLATMLMSAAGIFAAGTAFAATLFGRRWNMVNLATPIASYGSLVASTHDTSSRRRVDRLQCQVKKREVGPCFRDMAPILPRMKKPATSIRQGAKENPANHKG